MAAAGAVSSRTMSSSEPAGIRTTEVSGWLTGNVPGAKAPFTFDAVAGGRSNLTYIVTDAEQRRFVLRRPPLGHLLPSAHDMAREYRIISGLHRSEVPVPTPLGFCSNESVSDRPFYVMSFVDGLVLRSPAEGERLPVSARSHASESIADTLLALHRVDLDAVGLADLGKREGYIERQLRRWHSQFTDSKTREIPLVDDLQRRLIARVPPQQASTIVHGDYRLDNTIVGADGSVLAVLDWEICTLGDPLADLGLLLVYWPDSGDANPPLGAAASQLPGFWSSAQLRARYASGTKLDVSDLDFYVAFAYWKLACILEGVYARYVQGAITGDGYDHTVLRAQVPLLAEAADAALATLGA